jgi:hypothetical protein
MEDFASKKLSEPTEIQPLIKKISLPEEEEKEKKTQDNSKKKKWSFLAWLTSLFDRLFPKTSIEESLKKLNKDLLNFKDCLVLLTEADLSQDAHFLKQLSHSWKSFTKNLEPVALHKHPIILHIRKLFDEMHTYPSQESYSLGYYLSLYAGEDWIPFPYMEILKNLHSEYQKDPENNFLKKWIDHIQEIISFD